MRTKKEIEEDVARHSASEFAAPRLELEVLLDIRDLLSQPTEGKAIVEKLFNETLSREKEKDVD